jgi:hypothetical protein
MKMSESGIQREYNLSFDDTDSNIFAYELIECAAIGDFELPDKSKRYYMGIDVSTIGDDYTIGLILSEVIKDTMFQLCIDKEKCRWNVI